MMRNSFFLALTLLLVSCGNKNNFPPGVLSPGKMEDVLWDVVRAEAYTTSYNKTDLARNVVEENARLQQQIFALHKVSKVEFYKSFDYYKAHTSLMKTILDSIINKAAREPNYSIKPPTNTIKPSTRPER